jgi:hypothetical protein
MTIPCDLVGTASYKHGSQYYLCDSPCRSLEALPVVVDHRLQVYRSIKGVSIIYPVQGLPTDFSEKRLTALVEGQKPLCPARYLHAAVTVM